MTARAFPLLLGFFVSQAGVIFLCLLGSFSSWHAFACRLLTLVSVRQVAQTHNRDRRSHHTRIHTPTDTLLSKPSIAPHAWLCNLDRVLLKPHRTQLTTSSTTKCVPEAMQQALPGAALARHLLHCRFCICLEQHCRARQLRNVTGWRFLVRTGNHRALALQTCGTPAPRIGAGTDSCETI